MDAASISVVYGKQRVDTPAATDDLAATGDRDIIGALSTTQNIKVRDIAAELVPTRRPPTNDA